MTLRFTASVAALRADRRDGGAGSCPDSSADPSRLRETRGRRRRPALQPRADDAEGGRADRGAPRRPPRRRRRAPRRRADGRGRDRGGPAGQERHRSRASSASRFTSWTGRRTTPSTSGRSTSAPSERSSGPTRCSTSRTPANTWQKLRTERPGQFEKAVEPPPDPNGWFHVRIVARQREGRVYVNGAATPSLVVDDLGEAKSGGVALWAGNGSDGAYANLTITPTAPPGPPPESRQTIFQAAGDRQPRPAAGAGRGRPGRRSDAEQAERPDAAAPGRAQRAAAGGRVPAVEGRRRQRRRPPLRARRSTWRAKSGDREFAALAGVEGRARHAAPLRRHDADAGRPPRGVSLGHDEQRARVLGHRRRRRRRLGVLDARRRRTEEDHRRLLAARASATWSTRTPRRPRRRQRAGADARPR